MIILDLMLLRIIKLHIQILAQIPQVMSVKIILRLMPSCIKLAALQVGRLSYINGHHKCPFLWQPTVMTHLPARWLEFLISRQIQFDCVIKCYYDSSMQLFDMTAVYYFFKILLQFVVTDNIKFTMQLHMNSGYF